MVIDTAEFPEPLDPDDQPGDNPGWLSEDELRFVRGRMPVAYVEALPVQIDGEGRITAVGLLVRSNDAGVMSYALVSGRVRFGEEIRDALFRHLENDLGPMSFPQIPPNPVPTQVAEYFPLPSLNGYVDPRQHAISLVYVVPVTGSCTPRQDALEVTWMAPEDALSPETLADLDGGRGRLLRQLLSAHGC